MATSQIDIKSKTIELATEAFDTFCEDISGMFGVEMECQQQEPCPETVKTLKRRFKKIAGFNCIKSEGTLNGSFQIVFDKEGFFTLAGIIVMLPEQRILQNRKNGSSKDTEDMNDAFGEAGNMLVGSWDRVFRDELDGHGHFVQTDTFVGDPWPEPEEHIGLPSDQELLFIPYEMTIDPYPAFNCGVILQEKLFGGTSASDADQAADAEEKPEEKPKEEAKVQETAPEKTDSEEKATPAENKADESQPQEAPAAENTAEPENKAAAATEDKAEAQEPAQQEDITKEPPPEATSDTTDADNAVKPETEEAPKPDETPEAPAPAEEPSVTEEAPKPDETPEPPAPAEEPSVTEEAPKPDETPEPPAPAEEPSVTEEAPKPDETPEPPAPTEEPVINETEQPAKAVDSPKGAVSESIQRIVQSSANLPGEHLTICSEVHAEDIMQKEVLWADPEDTVQQATAKMQQADAGYIMVGKEDALEGLVSGADISGAVSVYLKPMFAKWRRPVDDATLQIRVKWIMTRPVQTIKHDASLTAIMNTMSQSGITYLPVIDQQGKVSGLVTAFDIFKALVNTDPDVSTAGNTNQAPPLE